MPARCAPRPRVRPGDDRAVAHAALANPARLRILDALRSSPAPQRLDDLAALVDRHPNTVRDHLAILRDAGYVERIVDRRGLPGRPAVLYRACATTDPAGTGCAGCRSLAQALGFLLLREVEEPEALATTAGRAWGEQVAAQHRIVRRAPLDGLQQLAEQLEAAGFPTQLETDAAGGPRLRHPTCPFAQLLEEQGPIACGFHLGIAEGLAAGLATGFEIAGIAASGPSEGCSVQLRRRPSTPRARSTGRLPGSRA